jgi:hypothetical protein
VLYGLLDLEAGSWELEHLGISINISSPTLIPPPRMITERHINERLVYLHVGDSSLAYGCQRSAAEFFAEVFPRSKGIEGVASC